MKPYRINTLVLRSWTAEPARSARIWIVSGSPAPDGRVTVSGHFIVKPGEIGTVLALWTELAEHVRAHEPGTELYLLEQDVDDPSRLWLHEIYQDEAAFEAHGNSQAIRDFADRLNALFAEMHLARTRRVVGVDQRPG